jgi:glycine cleavage system transcriptional repressor
MDPDRYLVLAAVGPDRPGLVAEVTHFITERGVNIEDSRMVILGAEFGLLILASASEEKLARLKREVSTLESRAGLTVLTRPTKSPEEHRRAASLPYLVTAEALDNEGIVRAVAHALHELGANIVSLETTAYNAPITGSPLFRLEARIDAPRGITLTHVRRAMEKVAETENIDIDVRGAPPA